MDKPNYHIQVHELGVFQYDFWTSNPRIALEEYNRTKTIYAGKEVLIGMINSKSLTRISLGELETLALEPK